MKVFVYTKERKPKKLVTVADVTEVREDMAHSRLYVTTSNGIEFMFDTSKVKTTVYQN